MIDALTQIGDTYTAPGGVRYSLIESPTREADDEGTLTPRARGCPKDTGTNEDCPASSVPLHAQSRSAEEHIAPEASPLGAVDVDEVQQPAP